MPRPRWEFALSVDRADRRPLFLQIANGIANGITRGRLKPGDPLPGTRELARLASVSRVTVLTAYEELAAQGWIVVERGRGARVSAVMPDASGSSRPAIVRGIPSAIYSVPDPPAIERWPDPRPGMLLLNSWPDTRLIRTEPLAQAFRQVLRKSARRVLAYGDPAGHPGLRSAVANMLATARGLPVRGDDIVITRGSQMALTLIARSALGPGKTIAVEALGYPHAWESFRQAGLQLVPIPVDEEGLHVATLEQRLARQRIDAVYVTPHHQFPTTVTLSTARRARLLDLARRRRMLIIEDDYDDAFHYEGPAVMPLASLDAAGVVLYLGTFSKVFAPGLRIGFVVAPSDVRRRLIAHRQFLDIHGDLAIEQMLAVLLADGEVQRHIRRVKRIYRTRRDLFADLLARQSRGRIDFTTPSGGVALWVRLVSGSAERWAEQSAARGVRFFTARTFALDQRPRPYARLGFASLNEEELRTAAHRLIASLPE